MNQIRVRYAPSPTGFLHIGNARTALFNYLFAKHHQGKFIIRIEDTDIARNVVGGEVSQLQNLSWLGLNWDEGPDIGGPFGPYRQSERLLIYKKYALQLLEQNLAYKEFSPDQTTFAIRFKVPANQIFTFQDLIRGSLSFFGQDIEDWVIIKSNGYPSYNFAAAIDDHLMQISHIFRGEEHITNTPKQIMIYQAFNWQIPQFAHMTLILNQKRKKLSKRDLDIMQFIDGFNKLGYLPQALFNFLSLLGFSPLSSKEILSSQELIELFDVARLNKSPAIFDQTKLDFFNNHYLKKTPIDQIVSNLINKNVFANIKTPISNLSWLTKFVALFQDRMNYMQQAVSLYQTFFPTKLTLSNEAKQFLKDHQSLMPLLTHFSQLLKPITFEKEAINTALKQITKDSNLPKKILFTFLRIISTGQMHGPSLPLFLELLGKKKVLANLETVLKSIS